MTDPEIRAILLYEEYRAYMRSKWGPGPWLPWKVDPEDRWLEWIKQRRAVA